MKTASKTSTTPEFKLLGTAMYMYDTKTGKVLGCIHPYAESGADCLYEADLDRTQLGLYVTLTLAKEAVLKAHEIAATKKILART